MTKYRWMILAIGFLLFNLAPSSSQALTVNAGFSTPNFQLLAISDFIEDPAIIEEGADIDFNALASFFYISMTANPDELDDLVTVRLVLELGPERLIEYNSPEFLVRDWFTQDHGQDLWSESYYNNQFDGAPWFGEDENPYYAPAQTFLNLIQGQFLRAATFFITFEIRSYPGNVTLSAYRLMTQLFNPSNPELLDPNDLEEVEGTPILFRWNWVGGPTVPEDWVLKIVQGLPDQDGEVVMQSPDPSSIRYNGHPQALSSHFYTGMNVGEDALEAGMWYYWQVIATIHTVVGTPYEYESSVFSFHVVPPGQGGFGGGGFAGGGAPRIPGDNPFGGLNPQPGGPPPRLEGGGVLERGGHDPAFNILAAIFSAEQLADLMTQFEGYSVSTITFDGISGRTLTQLNTFINQPGFQIREITVE